MDWQMIGTILSGSALMSGGIAWAIHKLNIRFEKLEVFIHEQTQQQSKRTDRLYEMFCEMQKEMKQSFCEMQKEIKDVYIYTSKERK